MNEKINADLKSIKFILERNKLYIFPLVIILICIVLFVQFTIPQFKDLLTARKNGKEASSRLQTLKENLNVLTNTNENSLDSQLKILNLALPANKDFSGILNAIYFAYNKTGLNPGSFSLEIGDLSEDKKGDNVPTINLSVPLNTGLNEVNRFVEIINKTVPLSEVFFIKIGDKASIVSLYFYYKPLGAPDYRKDSRIIPLTQKGISLINKLSGFKNMNSASLGAMPAATFSSQLNP